MRRIVKRSLPQAPAGQPCFPDAVLPQPDDPAYNGKDRFQDPLRRKRTSFRKHIPSVVQRQPAPRVFLSRGGLFISSTTGKAFDHHWPGPGTGLINSPQSHPRCRWPRRPRILHTPKHRCRRLPLRPRHRPSQTQEQPSPHSAAHGWKARSCASLHR